MTLREVSTASMRSRYAVLWNENAVVGCVREWRWIGSGRTYR